MDLWQIMTVIAYGSLYVAIPVAIIQGVILSVKELKEDE